MCGMWGSPQILPALATVGKTNRSLARSVHSRVIDSLEYAVPESNPGVNCLDRGGLGLENLLARNAKAPEHVVSEHRMMVLIRRDVPLHVNPKKIESVVEGRGTKNPAKHARDRILPTKREG